MNTELVLPSEKLLAAFSCRLFLTDEPYDLNEASYSSILPGTSMVWPK
jgi:hypothetical protein